MSDLLPGRRVNFGHRFPQKRVNFARRSTTDLVGLEHLRLPAKPYAPLMRRGRGMDTPPTFARFPLASGVVSADHARRARREAPPTISSLRSSGKSPQPCERSRKLRSAPSRPAL